MEELKDNIVGIVDHYLRFHDLMTGEDAADKILSLISKTNEGAEVPCNVGLAADHEQVDWLIMFEDTERHHESFTDEIAAREAFASHAMNWNCHLFKRMESR